MLMAFKKKVKLGLGNQSESSPRRRYQANTTPHLFRWSVFGLTPVCFGTLTPLVRTNTSVSQSHPGFWKKVNGGAALRQPRVPAVERCLFYDLEEPTAPFRLPLAPPSSSLFSFYLLFSQVWQTPGELITSGLLTVVAHVLKLLWKQDSLECVLMDTSVLVNTVYCFTERFNGPSKVLVWTHHFLYARSHEPGISISLEQGLTELRARHGHFRNSDYCIFLSFCQVRKQSISWWNYGNERPFPHLWSVLMVARRASTPTLDVAALEMNKNTSVVVFWVKCHFKTKLHSFKSVTLSWWRENTSNSFPSNYWRKGLKRPADVQLLNIL